MTNNVKKHLAHSSTTYNNVFFFFQFQLDTVGTYFFKSYSELKRNVNKIFFVWCVCNLYETKTQSMKFVFGPLFFDRITEEADRSAHKARTHASLCKFQNLHLVSDSGPALLLMVCMAHRRWNGGTSLNAGLGGLKLDYYSHLADAGWNNWTCSIDKHRLVTISSIGDLEKVQTALLNRPSRMGWASSTCILDQTRFRRSHCVHLARTEKPQTLFQYRKMRKNGNYFDSSAWNSNNSHCLITLWVFQKNTLLFTC